MKVLVSNILLVLSICFFSSTSMAQRIRTGADGPSDSNRFQYHVALGTGVYSGWGSTHAYTLVAPTFEYRLSPKVTAFGGFAASRDVNTSLYRWSPSTPSYAPRRNGTVAGGAAAGVFYRPNDRLTMAACAYYIGGQIDPLWNNSGKPIDLNAFGVSGAMNYRFKNNSSLSIFFDYVNDKTGALVDPWMRACSFGDPLFHNGWNHHCSPLSGIVPDCYFY